MLRTSELIREVVVETGSISTDELVRQLRLRGIEVSLKTIANTMAELVRSGEVTRVSSGQYLAGSVLDQDLKRVTSALRDLIEEGGSTVRRRGAERHSSAFALVEACFSLRVPYSTVQRVLDRVRAETEMEDTDAFSISVLLETLDRVIARAGAFEHADEVLVGWFGHAGVMPGTSNSKAFTVYVLGRRLLEMGFDDRNSFQRLNKGSLAERSMKLAEFDRLVGRVKGVGRATTSYFLLLLGIDRISPDLRLRRWVQAAIGDETRPAPSPAVTAQLLERAVEELRKAGIDCNARDIDAIIWHEASGQTGSPGKRTRWELPSAADLTEGSLVDWRPHDRPRTSERFHGIVMAPPEGDHVRVLWTETDSRRSLKLDASGPLVLPYEQAMPVEDVVPCRSRGSRHPTRPPERLVALGTVVDWDPGREAKERWHGVVVGFVDGHPNKAIVRWTASDTCRRLTLDGAHALVSPHYGVEMLTRLAPCVRGVLHPDVNNLRDSNGQTRAASDSTRALRKRSEMTGAEICEHGDIRAACLECLGKAAK